MAHKINGVLNYQGLLIVLDYRNISRFFFMTKENPQSLSLYQELMG